MTAFSCSRCASRLASHQASLRFPAMYASLSRGSVATKSSAKTADRTEHPAASSLASRTPPAEGGAGGRLDLYFLAMRARKYRSAQTSSATQTVCRGASP